MARPSLAQGASPLVAAKVPSELADRIDQVCAALDMSRSEVIRGALTAGLPVLESETAIRDGARRNQTQERQDGAKKQRLPTPDQLRARAGQRTEARA